MFKKINLLILFFFIIVNICVSSPCREPEVDNNKKQIYYAVDKFGVFKEYDLDRISRRLAQKEYKISEDLDCTDKINNIVLASLTFIFEDPEKSFSYYIGESDNSDNFRPIVFESYVSEQKDKVNLYEELKEGYSFQKNALDIYTVSQQIKSVFQEEGNNSQIELEILKSFSSLQSSIGNSIDILRKITSTLSSYIKEFNVEEDAKDDKFAVAVVNNKNLGNLIQDIEKCISQKDQKIDVKAKLFKYEKDFSKAITSFLYYFWHSEQRLINFLLDYSKTDFNEGFWEEISQYVEDKAIDREDIEKEKKSIKKIFKNKIKETINNISIIALDEKRINSLLSDEIEKGFFKIEQERRDKAKGSILGVFIHVHSRLNICPTCRYTLSKTCAHENSTLKSKIKDTLKDLLINDFFCKTLATFRLDYTIKDRKVSYDPKGSDITTEFEKHNFFLTKIVLSEADYNI